MIVEKMGSGRRTDRQTYRLERAEQNRCVRKACNKSDARNGK